MGGKLRINIMFSAQLASHCLERGLGGCGEGSAIEQFLLDAFEAVVAEMFELVLAAVGEFGRAVVRLLGCGRVLQRLTIDVASAVHYFNINFIYLSHFWVRSIFIPDCQTPIRYQSLLFIAQPCPPQQSLYTMKLIFLLGLIALAVAQFSTPDFSKIGETIKNGVVEAEQKVETLAKEEFENAGNLINKGLDKINEAVNPPAPATPQPPPQTAEDPKESRTEPAAIIMDVPVPVPISEQPKPQPTPEAKNSEAKPEEVKPVEQPKENAKPVEKKDKMSGEHKKGSKHGHKPHQKREDASSDSSNSSEDIEEERRPEKHEKKQKDMKERHERKEKHDRKEKHERKEKREYTTEEVEKWQAEREQRIKAKEEHMKKYENRNIEKNEGEVDREWERSDRPRKEHKRAEAYRDPKIEALNERVKLAMP